MKLTFDENISQSFEQLIIVCSLVLLAFLIVVVFLFVVFQKRKIKFITERNEAILKYQEEVARTQLEIQEVTLKNVGRELHDNIGQLLSVANLELNIFTSKNKLNSDDDLTEIKGLIGKSLREIRALSKNLNNEVIHQVGLVESTKNELNRLERLKFLKTEFTLEGNAFDLPKDDMVILFRIIQEFLSNVIKHAKATHLKICFFYTQSELKITAEDDGVGFEIDKVTWSSGLVNMKSRAQLIAADFDIQSEQQKGTLLQIKYLKKQV